MPFIINEDEALKDYLSGITVSDDKTAVRPVKVWFGQPDLEIRAQSYPYITIDLVDIVMDAPRAIHGISELPYYPEGVPVTSTGHSLVTESPVPLILVYQVSTFARHPRHDRLMISQLLGRLPFQFGGFGIAADNTVRRAYLSGFTNRDGTEDTKRLFSKVFTVSVESEIIPSRLIDVQQATSVNINYSFTIDQDVTAP